MSAATSRASAGGVVWSSAPQATSVRLRIPLKRGARSSAARARHARAKHAASTLASAVFRAATVAAFATANAGGNIRPIAVSSTAVMPSARTFSAMTRNGVRAASGNAGTTSARIRRSNRAPCRIASSAATKAPKPFPNTAVSGPRSSAVMTAATWSAWSATDSSATGVERPNPGRLMRVTRRDSASGPRTPSKTVRSVSSECNSRRPGPLPVWSCWTSSSSSAGMAYCGAVAGNSNVAVMTSFSRSRGGL